MELRLVRLPRAPALGGQAGPWAAHTIREVYRWAHLWAAHSATGGLFSVVQALPHRAAAARHPLQCGTTYTTLNIVASISKLGPPGGLRRPATPRWPRVVRPYAPGYHARLVGPATCPQMAGCHPARMIPPLTLLRRIVLRNSSPCISYTIREV